MYLKMLIHSSLIQVRKLLYPHVDEYRQQIPRNERSSKTWRNLGSSSNQACIRTPTDQRGEQTINKDAKTTGIVTGN